LKVEVGEITLGLDIDPEKGSADSGDLELTFRTSSLLLRKLLRRELRRRRHH